MSKSALIWGSLLILIGFLLILSNLGIIQVNVWGVIWAVLLIGLGVWLLVGFTARRSARISRTQIRYQGSNKARVTFRHGAGRLNVRSSSSSEFLLSGDFAGGVEVNDRKVGDSQEISLQVPSYTFPGWLPGGALDWTVELRQNLPLELTFETGAQETNLDLMDLLVTSLQISTGASNTRVRLPANAGRTRVDLKAGAASFDLSVPDGVAARIRSSSGLSTVNVDAKRFPRSEGMYKSPDFESAHNLVDIYIESGLATVNIR